MRDVNSLKGAMQQEVGMLDTMEELIANNQDLLTPEEREIVNTYIDSVYSPWSLIMTLCERIIEKQKAEKEVAEDDIKSTKKARAKKAPTKKEEPAPEPEPKAEAEEEDEDWDFLGEED